MSDECCDDPDDACNDDIDWDDDLGPVKEEPDCFDCNDAGCAACARHPQHCDCADCFDHFVWEYEIFDDPDRELVYAGPFVDEPPF